MTDGSSAADASDAAHGAGAVDLPRTVQRDAVAALEDFGEDEAAAAASLDRAGEDVDAGSDEPGACRRAGAAGDRGALEGALEPRPGPPLPGVPPADASRGRSRTPASIGA